MKELYNQIAKLDPEKQELFDLLIETDGLELSDLLGSPSDTLDLNDGGAGPATSEDVMMRISREVSPDKPKDLLVYLHIPFCSSKCHFCDWVKDIPVKQLRSGPSVRRDYIKAITDQIAYYGTRLMGMGYVPKYVYWGGGTPTRLDGDEIAEIVKALNESFDLTSIQEHTMESSPETLTMEKLETMLESGIRRLSIGIQSFNDEELRKSARAHSAAGAENAMRMAQKAGYKNINLDLIAAFPDQTLEMWKRSLMKTIELEPAHITVYLYRPSSETVMANQIISGIKKAVGHEQMFAYNQMAQELLTQAGYIEYSFGYYAKGVSTVLKEKITILLSGGIT